MFTLSEKLKFKIGFFLLNKKYTVLYKLANGRCGGAPMIYKKDSKEIPSQIKKGYKQEKIENSIDRIIKDDMWMVFYDADGDEFAMKLIEEYCAKFSNKPDRFF